MPASSHIADFADTSRRDPERAMLDLRLALGQSRGPLVEAVQDSDEVLVTFVYIGRADRVVLTCPLLFPPDPGSLDVLLDRVTGSDVWFASTQASPEISIPYSFQVDRPELGVQDLVGMHADPARLLEEARRDIAACRADVFNPDRIYPLLAAAVDPDAEVAPERWESVLTLPAAPGFPYDLDSPLSGALETHRLQGVALPGDRGVSVYLPPGYDPTVSLPVLVILDGDLALRVGRLHHLLDAAIAAGDLPPLLAVFWHNLSPVSRTTEMACNPALAADLADVMLPWLRGRFAVTPESCNVVLMGLSLGGLASLHAAHARPEAFGAAIAVSPALSIGPAAAGAGEPGEWLTRHYVADPQLQLRLWVGVGSLEVTPVTPDGSSMVTMARRFYESTSDAGYDVRGYTECPGGHDVVVVRRTLVAATQAVLAD